MDSVRQTPRKRVVNFTTIEKSLLAELIKKRPIMVSKLTDGKSIEKKKLAWDFITKEFNCDAHVHQRNTITLKRAWDNMKAMTRKVRRTERGNLTRTDDSLSDSLQPPLQEPLVTIVEEAAPVIKLEIENPFDSDAPDLSPFQNENNKTDMNVLQDKTVSGQDITSASNFIDIKCKSVDYTNREALLCLKFLKSKTKIEMQILKAQLETAESNKRTANIEEERSKIRLEVVKLELEKLRKH